MRRLIALFLLVTLAVGVGGVDAGAQRRRRTPPKPLPPKVEPANAKCLESLGIGQKTAAEFCFVLAGRDPARGIVITLPRRTGPATLFFDLHNRHTYSEEDIKRGRAYASYLAVVGVVSLKGEPIDRAAVRSEFRKGTDLYDRIKGGAGPSGLKAVAPIGCEQIAVTIPAGIDEVSLLGETLEAITAAGREVATPGRPVAIVSNLRIEYRPRP